jgi:hypothetical protein
MNGWINAITRPGHVFPAKVSRVWEFCCWSIGHTAEIGDLRVWRNGAVLHAKGLGQFKIE